MIEKFVDIKENVVNNAIAFSNLSNLNNQDINNIQQNLSNLNNQSTNNIQQSLGNLQNLESRRIIFDQQHNTVKISYLARFPIANHGLYDMGNPIYEPLTAQVINSAKHPLICKTEFVNTLRNSNIRYQEVDKKNILNSVFIVKR